MRLDVDEPVGRETFSMNWVKSTGLGARHLKEDDVEDLNDIEQMIQEIEIGKCIHEDELIKSPTLLVDIVVVMLPSSM